MDSNEKVVVKYDNDKQKELDDFEADLDEFYKEMPVSEETRCGFWMVKGDRLQSMANKKMLIFLFGLSGCIFSSTFAYFNGTITTIEKRFKIPSKVTGVISVGNDITQLLGSIILNYYAAKGHRPKWIAFGLFCVAIFCFSNALPHFIYGPGNDALQLTLEYGADFSNSTGSRRKFKTTSNLCNANANHTCTLDEGSIIPPVILFVSQLISGIGGTLFHILGYSYMDDNIKRSKSPTFISISYFMRMLGPAFGYAMVSICLKFYIAPELTPTIDNLDPRWLGAWWIGWIFLGMAILIFAFLVSMLPKTLPRAAARNELMKKKSIKSQLDDQMEPSWKDMMETVKRLLNNPVYNYNNIASVFFVFGYIPFWVFLPKYIEAQYKKSASAASLITGSVGLAFSALGILLSGFILQKFKPKGKFMAFWNMIIDTVTTLGVLSYSLLGCPDVDGEIPILSDGNLNMTLDCNANCQCDYAKFSPVCAIEQMKTFISACHAGCTQQNLHNDGSIIYTNCSCIESVFPSDFSDGSAISGPCPVDCQYQFYFFVAIVCCSKLIGSMSRVTNFLVSIRCVEERDKTVSMGIHMSLMSLFALIPAPIFFGYLIDSTCLVWGKTCTVTGNCWYFNSALLRERIVYTSAVFLTIGVIFDMAVWLKIPDINMFNDDMEMINKDEYKNEAANSEEIVALDSKKNIS